MKTLKGKLRFISLFEPIMVGDIDLRDYYFELFKTLNGVKSKMDYSMNSIEISADENSDKVVKYENNENGILILLNNADGSFGMSNIGAYLPDMLQRLNGMKVIASITGNSIKITNDLKEKVFEIYYTRNNCCKIPDDKIKTVCKIGEKDCCIFICAGSDGFECLKFDSPSARMLLDRYSKKDMRASRIGNCKIVGRKETV
jgi:hypothetical protein